MKYWSLIHALHISFAGLLLKILKYGRYNRLDEILIYKFVEKLSPKCN